MTNMFFQTWVKYIPIIRILLKRSLKEGQKLEMNGTDFSRAAGGRKVKYSFTFALHNGRLQHLDSAPPLGRGLIDALLDDAICNRFLKENHLEFSMNKNFELMIRNNTPAVTEAPETVKEATGAEDDKAMGESPTT
jgi:hypothetical protein